MLSPEAIAALRLFPSYAPESLNAYGLSELLHGAFGHTPQSLAIIKELEAEGFVTLTPPVVRRFWNDDGDHYTIDRDALATWAVDERTVEERVAAASGTTPHGRRRLSALAS
jgi:hypothetical protein